MTMSAAEVIEHRRVSEEPELSKYQKHERVLRYWGIVASNKFC